MREFQDWEVCRSILESLPAGVCVVNLEKRVIFWSDGAERITGYPRYDVVGRDCLTHILPHCDKSNGQSCPPTCPIDSAIRDCRRLEGTGFIHHKAGQKLQLLMSAAPVRNAHGSIIGAVLTFDDAHNLTNPEHREEIFKLSGCVDEVTGLPNHAMMQSHLREALSTFLELHVPFAIVYLAVEELEHFRSNSGRLAAARVLRAIAQTLDAALWKSDFLGRWSDDRFLILLNGCNDETVQSVNSRLGRVLANDAIEWWGDTRSLSVSLGFACARPGDGMESLLQRAEESLAQNASALSLKPQTSGS
jgi:diguanylate cyclase (GGDEF)-like protein/PAS domain S-box-containing protein